MAADDPQREAAERLAAARARILAATLAHVPFDGWSAAALRHGARDAGADRVTLARAFPRGARDALALWSADGDAAMAVAIDAAREGGGGTTARIRAALDARIAWLAPQGEALRRALAFLALPGHAALAARLLARTVDEIWWRAGDRTSDFSWYTKRATLAAVWSATLLVLAGDRSEGQAATRAFLDRRLADVGRIPKLRARIQGLAGAARPAARLARTLAGLAARRRAA
ncbi:MAG: COQ9 family protein [Alphaproteobacteria bacterium]